MGTKGRYVDGRRMCTSQRAILGGNYAQRKLPAQVGDRESKRKSARAQENDSTPEQVLNSFLEKKKARWENSCVQNLHDLGLRLH